MTIDQWFHKKALDYGPRLAIEQRLRYRTLRWTYRELGVKTRDLAALLGQRGIGPGDRVLLFGPNSPWWVASYFAVLSRGAVAVPLNPQSVPEQLDLIVASAQPKLLMKPAGLAWRAQPVAVLDMESEDTGLLSHVADSAQVPDHDAAVIMYTSGTTGEPKGVMLSHANILANLEALSARIRPEEDAHFLSIIPLFHMYAQTIGLLFPLHHGCAVTYLSSLGSRAILEAFRYTPVTHLVAVPEFLSTVMARVEKQIRDRRIGGLLHSCLADPAPKRASRLLLSFVRRRISRSLHTIACGGAALEAGLESRWRALGFHVLQGYGLTEASPVISTNTYKDHRLGSVGKILPGVELHFKPDGEILIRGPNVTAGYHKDEAKTQEAFEEGWFKTGDIGRLDSGGFLFLQGRKKYVIIGPGGENVFPEDIEAALNHVGGVRDSAVAGVEKAGHTVIYAVVLGDHLDADAVVQEANRHLAPHQQIQACSVWPQADFPRSATRKVRKEEVIRWIHEREEGREIPRTGTAVSPLVRVLAEVTRRDPAAVTPNTRILQDLHLDSLLRIELVSRIEEVFNVAVEEKMISQQTSVADLEKLIAAQKGKAAVLIRYPRWSLRVWARILRPWLQSLLFFSWLRLIVRLRVRGSDHLRTLEGPVIFMATHRSYLDSLVVLRAIPSRLRRRLCIAAATDVLYRKYWWFAPAADLIFNSYPFPRAEQENIRQVLDYSGRLMDDGWSVLVYPEGQMNLTDEPVLPLKGGAGVLAVELRSAVVPIVITGTAGILPPGRLLPRRRDTVNVIFGEPLRFRPDQSYSAVTEQIWTSLRDISARVHLI